MDAGAIVEDAAPRVMFDSPTQQRTRDFLDKVL
jgi:ABC-type polar amino acid transport system ATPase subunit